MYKIVRRIQDNDRIFGYVIADEKGNTQDILAKQLIQYIDAKKISVGVPTNKGIKAITKEDIYADLGVLFVLVAIVGDVYVVVNQKTKEQKKVAKDELIKSVSSGAILVSNIYLRKTAKGGVSIVCKEPEKVKKMEAKPTEQVKKVEDTHEGKVHYQGKLGDFWYDPTEFEKAVIFTNACLHYIGNKSKDIVIPEGVTNCTHMFNGCKSLQEAPEIPSSVTDCSDMFYECTSLVKAPEIPEGVTNCRNMFAYCTSLVKAPKIPEGVKNCECMFHGCTSLVKAPEISSSVTDCKGMFERCTSLKEAPEIPEGVKNCEFVFEGCTSLKKAPEIPQGVTNCGWMFKDCTSLVEAPKIPSSVIDCYSMFMDCTSLLEAPTIPKGVKYCSAMFLGCTSLVKAPTIPSSVKNCESMFEGCSEEVQKQGEYNIKHRV